MARDPRSSPNPRKGRSVRVGLGSRAAPGQPRVWVAFTTEIYGLSDGATGTYAGRAYRHYHLHCPRRDAPPQTVEASLRLGSAQRQRGGRLARAGLNSTTPGPTGATGCPRPHGTIARGPGFLGQLLPRAALRYPRAVLRADSAEFLQSLRHWRTPTPPDNLDFLRALQRVERAHAPLARGAFTPSCRRPGRRGSWPRGSHSYHMRGTPGSPHPARSRAPSAA